MGASVGIDLGTTNSAVAVFTGGEPVVIPNAEGGRLTPSVVAVMPSGEVVVGEQAKHHAATRPERTFSSIKRRMGDRWTSDPIDGYRYTPEEISARTLMKLKRDAEAYLGSDVTEAVITVPAYFGHSQRKATHDAATIAGLAVQRIISEPTAAALAHGLTRGPGAGTILVFDLGGGSLDVSVLEFSDGLLEVKATCGDADLGGDDWDRRIVDWLVRKFEISHGVDLSHEAAKMQRLKEAAEVAKIELTQLHSAQVFLPYIVVEPDRSLHLDETLTRSEFREMTADLIERCRTHFEQALIDARVTKSDIDQVVLVGGSTRMPAVSDLMLALTGREPSRTLNPEEAGAVGAAIQAAVIHGDFDRFVALDVTPSSIGIEAKGGVMAKLFERNTTVPTSRIEVLTMTENEDASVELHLLQGESELASENRSLGRVQFVGIPPSPQGDLHIEVRFDIDANGTLHVHARDQATSRAQSIRIADCGSLDEESLEQMAIIASSQERLRSRGGGPRVEDGSGISSRPDPIGAKERPATPKLTEVIADFEAHRRRSAQRTTEEVERSVRELIDSLLPIIDAAEVARSSAPAAVGPVLDALLAELGKYGLEQIEVDGRLFDPHVAEAVNHEGGAGSEIVVVETLRRGYLLNGRLLRAAMVRTRNR